MDVTLDASDRLARLLAFAIPALLLSGALISEHVFGLYPCEMCWWQRYGHIAAIGLAFLGAIAPQPRLWVGLAALAIAVSGLIGVAHVGVEYGWWQGITTCSSDDFNSFVLVRCDKAEWTLWGISLAGWNALFSLGGAMAIWALLLVKEKAA